MKKQLPSIVKGIGGAFAGIIVGGQLAGLSVGMWFRSHPLQNDSYGVTATVAVVGYMLVGACIGGVLGAVHKDLWKE